MNGMSEVVSGKSILQLHWTCDIQCGFGIRQGFKKKISSWPICGFMDQWFWFHEIGAPTTAWCPVFLNNALSSQGHQLLKVSTWSLHKTQLQSKMATMLGTALCGILTCIRRLISRRSGCSCVGRRSTRSCRWARETETILRTPSPTSSACWCSAVTMLRQEKRKKASVKMINHMTIIMITAIAMAMIIMTIMSIMNLKVLLATFQVKLPQHQVPLYLILPIRTLMKTIMKR